jgi:UPF0755 protein
MTMRSGQDPKNEGRRGVRNSRSAPKTPFVDTGWDGYDPDEPVESGSVQKQAEASENRRNFKASRAGGAGAVLRFALFAFVLGGLVLGSLYFFARPAVVHAIASWGAENPNALQLPFVADIVRSDLGTTLTQPVDATDFSEVVFQITEGETTAEIGQKLLGAGLIADDRAFVFEAIERNQTRSFIAGRHVLSKAMTVDQIIDKLTSAPVAPPTVHVVFREGLRIEQMVAKLEYLEANPADPAVTLKLDVAEYYTLAKNPPALLVARYPWLKLPPGASLEGFLFPATYDLAPATTPLELIEQQLDAFAANAPAGLVDLAPDKIYETVQIASLVEPEAKLDADRPLVAGVYVNRLDIKKWPTGLMNSDPSVQYAIDSVWLSNNPMSSWVTYSFFTSLGDGTPLAKLTFPDAYAPYNSYSHAGLPPTPICSPGAASLLAAMSPDTTDGYYYFLAKNDGSNGLVFAKTNEEQIANEKKYGYINP